MVFFEKLLAVGLLLVLSGCAVTPFKGAATDVVFKNKNHVTMVDMVKNDRTLLETMASRKDEVMATYAWCDASYTIRDYKEFMDCAEKILPMASKDEWKPGNYYPGSQDSWAEISAEILTWRSLLRQELGQFEQAEKDAEKALAILDSDWHNPINFHVGFRKAWRLRFIGANRAYGLVMARLGHREKAIESINKIKEVDNVIRRSYISKKKYPAIAHIHLALHDYEDAKDAIESYSGMGVGEILFAGVGAFGATAGLSAISLVGNAAVMTMQSFYEEIMQSFFHAKVAFETGDYVNAKIGYDALLGLKELGAVTGLHYVILHDRAQIYLNDGKRAEAIELLRQSVDVIESQRSSISTESSKIGFVGDKQKVYHALVSVLFDQGKYAEAFEYVERGKARALVDMLASKDDFRETSQNAKVSSLLKDLESLESSATTSFYRQGIDKEAYVRSGATEIKKKLQAQTPELASLVTVAAQSLEALQQILLPNETLVEYYYYDDDVYAFIVSRKTVEGIKLDVQNLPGKVHVFRKDIQNYQSSSYRLSSKELYTQLVKPLEGKLVHTKLIIVPHGALHLLPFNALHDGKQFIIEKYSIRVLPSASVMTFLGKNQLKAESLLALGNPDLGNPEYDLPFAQAEAVNVAKKVRGGKVLLRKDATETAVKQYGASFRYLHFATHGTFDAEKPLTSGLMLAKDASNDGVLSVGELYDLELNAELVTLSACETALGKITNGDDVVGFTRGFLYAGARSIVSSLWQVDDQATSLLMDSFYTNLHTKDKRDALRKAQLDVKKSYNEHPFFWGAFQLTGSM